MTYEWKQRDGDGQLLADIVTLSVTEVRRTLRVSVTIRLMSGPLTLMLDPNPDLHGAGAGGGGRGPVVQLRLEAGAGGIGAKSTHAEPCGMPLATELLGLWSPPSEARFTILGLAPTGLAVASKPVSGTSYRLGEAIEVAVTFGDRVLVNTSQGTPTLALTVGTQTRQASYVRGTGTTQLVFAYTVVAADSDTDGIAVAADALALNGGAITNAYGVPALLDHDAVEAQSGHGADGTQTPGFSLTGGVCGRTGQVRDKLVDLVNDVAANSAVTNCSLVTETHLGALAGTLDLSSASIAALKAGDFAGLGGITTLNLNDNALPALPARVFEPLTGLTTLRLDGNPGAAGFAPVARAGPSGGFDAVSGGSVTLGLEGAAAGQDDPWGSNVKYSWSLTEGAGGTLTAETTARADFAAPVTAEDANRTVRLTVTGRGAATSFEANRHSASDDVAVRVAAGPKVERVSFATLPLSAGGPAYTVDGVVSVTLGFDRAVTVTTADGTPSVSLTVGTATKTAGYLSGTGTRSLTFGYTVVAADTDTDGVDMAADSLALNGGRITGVSDGGAAALGHAGLAGSSDRPVNGSGAPVVSGGICGRTAAVQAAVLARVRTAEDDATLACGAVTPAMLTAIAGRLDVSAQVSAHGRMTALKAGDFAWLANVTALDLDRHALRSFPAGVFDGLAALQELSVAYNQTQAADRMTTLPAGLFDRLTKLTDAAGLSTTIWRRCRTASLSRLTRLTTLTFDGNPGSASFLPVAVAGPAGGLDAEAGELVTLGGAPGGLWGGNLVHAWRQVAGPTEALSASNAAAPSFTAPALGRAAALEYELTATGRGTLRTATDSVTVRVAPSAVVASLAAVSGPVSGDTYRRGEMIGVAVTFGKPVAVTGTPQLALSVGTATRQAAYARGTGTTQLVFEYTVVEADRDPDGIAVAANALTLNNGTIADADAGGAAADLGHGALTAQSGHKVDGSLAGLTGGICGRTPEVRDALLVRVRTVNAGLSCAQVTTTHLGALTGTLSLSWSGHPGAPAGGLRRAHQCDGAGPRRQRDDFAAGRRVRRAGRHADPARPVGQRPRLAVGRAVRAADRADRAGSVGQRSRRPADAPVRETDWSDRAHPVGQPRQRAVQACRQGRTGGRGRCGPGGDRDPGGRGRGGRLRRPLGHECYLGMDPDCGDIGDPDERNDRSPGVHCAFGRRDPDLYPHGHRQGRHYSHRHRLRPGRRGGHAADAEERGGERRDADADLRRGPADGEPGVGHGQGAGLSRRGGRAGGAAQHQDGASDGGEGERSHCHHHP